jgi:hypothetical protein
VPLVVVSKVAVVEGTNISLVGSGHNISLEFSWQYLHISSNKYFFLSIDN